MTTEATSWWSERSGTLSAEDQERLAEMLCNAPSTELGKHFKLAGGPEPGTLRLRVVLTQARATKVLSQSVMSRVGELRVPSTIVGATTIEMEAVDAVTNERLAAAVDAREGTEVVFAKRTYERWGDVQAAIDYWSKRLTWRLARHGVQLKPGASMPEEPKEGCSL